MEMKWHQMASLFKVSLSLSLLSSFLPFVRVPPIQHPKAKIFFICSAPFCLFTSLSLPFLSVWCVHTFCTLFLVPEPDPPPFSPIRIAEWNTLNPHAFISECHVMYPCKNNTPTPTQSHTRHIHSHKKHTSTRICIHKAPQENLLLIVILSL